MKLNLEIIPRHQGLLAGQKNKVEFMVRISAPEEAAKTFKRKPLNLAIVIDRSGSMASGKLEEAVRCAEHMVNGLDAMDRVAIVSYDDSVEVEVPSTQASNKAMILAGLHRLYPRGMTNLHGGWLAGVEQVSAYSEGDYLSRVLLLSDGQANEGLTNVHQIAEQCRSFVEANVTTSTYGVGLHFNEHLMSEMARAGAGNAYYGQTADDLIDPFSEEFDLLRALVANNVSVQVDGIGDINFELLNDYPSSGLLSHRFPNVASQGDVWGVFRATVPQQLCGKGEGELCQIFKKIIVNYVDNEGVDHTINSDALALPSLPPSAWNQIVADETVEDRLAELEASRIQREASVAARRGDWNRVDALLQEAKLLAENNVWIRESLKVLEGYARRREMEMFSKESNYTSLKMSRRMVSRQESRSVMDDKFLDMPAFLIRKGEQGKKGEDQ